MATQRKSETERKVELQQKIAKLESKLKKLDARERKLDTRRKIIVGGFMLASLSNSKLSGVREFLRVYFLPTVQARDKALFEGLFDVPNTSAEGKTEGENPDKGAL